MRKLIPLVLAAAIWAPTSAQAQSMVASFYWEGKRTATGERFNPDGMTCAHKTMRFGTRLRVTYHGRSAVCRVNDRGPYIRGRQLDLSRGVARSIGFAAHGVGRVEVDILG